MGFMTAELTHEKFVEVETARGESYSFPACVMFSAHTRTRVWYHGRRDFRDIARQATEYAPEYIGRVNPGDVKRVLIRTRWASRLTAPGYMDCTDWNVSDTAAGALEALSDQFGDECETAREIASLAEDVGAKGFEFEECGDESCPECGGDDE